MNELRALEDELDGVNEDLSSLTEENRELKRNLEKTSRPTVDIGEDDRDQLERLRDESDQVLEEIAR